MSQGWRRYGAISIVLVREACTNDAAYAEPEGSSGEYASASSQSPELCDQHKDP
jgi:hypothetical protein